MTTELAQTLLEHLIEKAFEGMSSEEKLNFIERMFADLDPEGKERFLRQMIQSLAPDGVGEARPAVARAFNEARRRPEFIEGAPPGAPMMLWSQRGRALHEFGPWQRCCRMMMAISEAPRYDSARANDAARVFEALANETRLKIIKLLQEGERHVEELTQTLGLAQSTVSHHLRVLKDAGLVRAEKRGRSMYYSIVPGTALENESGEK